MNTIDIIKKIVTQDEYITGIYIHSFPNAPGLEKKIKFTDVESTHYKAALKLRDKSHVPFWDALMLSFYNKSEFSDRILENVLNSHAKRDKQLISREDVLNGSVLEKLQNGSANFAINSQIQTKDGKQRHLLLLDFHIPENENNQVIVEKVLELLKLKKGYLLKSGRSYHFIGIEAISTYKLISLISKGLFFTPIIDKSWIAHQLIDKSCSIRFTKKRKVLPTLIKVVKNKI
jgi:hypothetical protein